MLDVRTGARFTFRTHACGAAWPACGCAQRPRRGSDLLEPDSRGSKFSAAFDLSNSLRAAIHGMGEAQVLFFELSLLRLFSRARDALTHMFD